MKTATLTALIALIVAIPFVLRKRKWQRIPIAVDKDHLLSDVDLRYDINDLLS